MIASASLRITILLGAMSCIASAQVHPHFGIAGGAALTDTLDSSQSSSGNSGSSSFSRYNSKTKRLLVGPVFRLDLVGGFGLELDALWQRINFDTTSQSSSPPSFANYSFGQTTANRWQFPFLIQYSHALSKTRAFIEAGPAISHVAGSSATIHSISTAPLVTNPAGPANGTTTSTNTSSYTGQGGTQAGIVFGGGVDITMFHLHVRPEFRYSHWFTAGATSQGTGVATTAVLSLLPYAGGFSPPGVSSFQTRSNEASVLLEIVF